MRKKMYKILTHFANSHSVSIGGNIKAEMTEYGTHLYSEKDGSKIEDAVYLGDIIRGAQQFCYYLERNKYDIVRRTNVKSKDRI